VRKTIFAASASVDVLRATRAPTGLALISPLPDTGVARQNGGLFCLAAVDLRVGCHGEDLMGREFHTSIPSQ
jgi:hypothetical protein